MKDMITDRYSLLYGDCLERMKEIEDNSIDLILCDLPYGTTACKWDIIIPFEDLWSNYKRVLKDKGSIVLFGTEPFSSMLRTSNLKMFKYDWIWCKNIKTNFVHAKHQPLRQYEIISVFYNKVFYNPIKEEVGVPTRKAVNSSYGELLYEGKKRPIYYGGNTDRYPSNLLYFNVVDIKKRLHPTQKPIDLLEYLIKTYTNEGMTVLDNCMGSGSTGVACLNTNRKFIGIEMDEEYFDISCERINGVSDTIA